MKLKALMPVTTARTVAAMAPAKAQRVVPPRARTNSAANLGKYLHPKKQR